MYAQKRYAIVITFDRSACSYVRWREWSYILNSTAGGQCELLVFSEPVYDEYLLYHAASVVIARPIIEEHFACIRKYASMKKKYGYSVNVDFDDLLWTLQGKSPFPSWNKCTIDTDTVHTGIRLCSNLVDSFYLSTKFLALAFAKEFTCPEKIKIMPNYAFPQLFHDCHGRRTHRPVIAYTGGTTHITPTELGDFEGPWLEALEKATAFADFYAFGDKNPFYPKETKYLPYVHASEYPGFLSEMAPDIIIAPLATHPFNKCKSDIKAIEGTLVGAVVVGSDFPDSPYKWVPCRVSKDTTADSLLAMLRSLCSPVYRKKIVKEQKSTLEISGHYCGAHRDTKVFLRQVFGKYLD